MKHVKTSTTEDKAFIDELSPPET